MELKINKTFLKDSKDLVADISISGNLRNKKTLELKILKGTNTISIKNDQTGGEIECIVTNSKGDEVFSEVIKGDAIHSFESMSGEGNIILVLNSGNQDSMIIINGDELHK
ncbi:hypothetical protein [Peribacillus sp. NPDC097895]|uniref:hypothetical protein n=1 Tax=Peribacillus sp. NPDC097895 TaxID=3390619 RepID=UPI003D0592EA